MLHISLKLWAIKILTNWTGQKIAKLTADPQAAARGDWAAVVKTPSAAINKIFDKWVVKFYLED